MNLLVLLLQNLVGTPVLLAVASYVLTALALYTVARRRGLKNPWLAWIPVASAWIVGSLSDQPGQESVRHGVTDIRICVGHIKPSLSFGGDILSHQHGKSNPFPEWWRRY